MIKLSEILRSIRKETGVSQERLCLGLCSKGTYSKYESGEKVPSWLILSVFLQRMGRNVEKLSVVLATEEYQYFCWKKEILTALEKKDFVTVAQLQKKVAASDDSIHPNLQLQFRKLVQAIAMRETLKTEMEKRQYIALLKQAADLTMPGIRDDNMESYLISESELLVLFEWIRGMLQVGKEDEAYRFLKAVLRYIDTQYKDEEIRIKTYPKAVIMIIPLLHKRNEYMEGAFYCKKAIELLCQRGVLYDLVELIRTYLSFRQDFSRTKENVCFEHYLWALEEIYQMFGYERFQTESNVLSYQNQELYLVNEVIRLGRENRKLTQEKLSEEICTPETLSRIETGKRAPSTKNFRAFMKKSDMEIDYYNGEVVTDDFFVLEKKQELSKAISLHQWEEAERLLEWVKGHVDMGIARNYKAIHLEECCILYNQGKLDTAEFMTVCEEIMECQNDRWRKEEFWNQFFTKQKIDAMNYLACLYQQNGQMESAIFIAEHLLNQLRNSKVRLADRYKSSGLVTLNLSSWYGKSGEYEKCMEMCDLGIQISLECGRGISLVEFLVNRAETVDILVGKPMETSRLCFQWTYYIATLFSYEKLSSYAENYYKLHYEPDIDWL